MVSIEAIEANDKPIWGFQTHLEATESFVKEHNLGNDGIKESFKFGNKLLDKFIHNHYLKMNSNTKSVNKYDFQLSSLAIKNGLINNINKLQPFGNYNFLPTFLIKNLKVIKRDVLSNKHLTVILKPESGGSIKGICFNCLKTNIGHYLLSYKKKINIIGQISENIWNNKKTIQLNIKDLIL